VKAARFEYHAPTTIDEAVSLLHEHGDECKALAGGQSLVPILALRLARFGSLVDLNNIPSLAGIEVTDGALRIGAMTRQSTAEHSEVLVRAAPLLARALPFVGHFQIRNRGTVGGSIAHGDPASEIPAVVTALGGELEARSVSETRRIPVDGFFSSVWETALEPDELLVAVHLPLWSGRSGFGFEELAWRHGDFPIAGALCALTLDARHRVATARIALMGMGTTPVRAAATEAALGGASVDELDLESLGALAVEATSPVDDVHASASYRRRVCGAMVRRVIAQAIEEARSG
jgi:carbon-monoxide dehydrogenase medium subunit